MATATAISGDATSGAVERDDGAGWYGSVQLYEVSMVMEAASSAKQLRKAKDNGKDGGDFTSHPSQRREGWGTRTFRAGRTFLVDILNEMLEGMRFLWNATRGNRLRPWRSPYLRWRLETYSGKPAETLKARDFFHFGWSEKGQFLRFLRWTARFAVMQRTARKIRSGRADSTVAAHCRSR